jgi:hypothetical protein
MKIGSDKKKSDNVANLKGEDPSNPLLVIKMSNSDIMSCWRAIKKILELEIPANAADAAFLMETMSDMAKIHNPKIEKSDTKQINRQIYYKKAVAVWHCLNICVSNENIIPPEALSQCCAIQTNFAQVLDATTDNGIVQEEGLDLA